MTSKMRGRLLCDHERAGCNSFSLVRVLAAMAVVVSHNYGIFSGEITDPLEAWTGFTLGQHAVHVFFCLSGVLIAMSLARSHSLRQFAWARFLRIMPALFVCVVLTVLVLGPLTTTLPLSAYLADAQIIGYIGKTITLMTAKAALPGVFDMLPVAGEINLSLWTLKYEVLCYALLALIAGFGLQRHAGYVLAIAMAVLTLTFVLEAVSPRTAGDNLRRFLLCFCLGAAAYDLRAHVRYSASLCALLTGLALALFPTRLGVPALLLATAALTLTFGTRLWGQASTITDRVDASYGIYIYGWPIGQTVLYLAPSVTAVGHQVATVLVSAMFGIASWLLIERPALGIKRRLFPALRIRSTRPGSQALSSDR